MRNASSLSRAVLAVDERAPLVAVSTESRSDLRLVVADSSVLILDSVTGCDELVFRRFNSSTLALSFLVAELLQEVMAIKCKQRSDGHICIQIWIKVLFGLILGLDLSNGCNADETKMGSGWQLCALVSL